MGRSLDYNCIQLVGANIAGVMRGVQPLIAVTLGISLLSEPVTWELIGGVLLIVCGVTITGLSPQVFRSGHAVLSSIPRKAFLFGMGAGLAWGIGPILIKLGLNGSDSPAAGAFISYLAATIVLGMSLWNQNRRAALVGMKSKTIGLFGLAGLFSAFANLMRYTALSMAPVSVVAPLFFISPVFLLVLSFLFNRKLEVFTINVIVGIITVTLGSILLV